MSPRKSTRLLLWLGCFGTLVFAALAVAAGLLLWRGPEIGEGTAWLRVVLDGSIDDGPGEGGFHLDPSAAPLTVTDYATEIREAAGDDSVTGLLIDFREPGLDLAAAQELRLAVLAFTAAGKPCRAWSKTYDNATWYLATACDEIALHPEGVPFVVGLRLATTHFAGTFEKLGLQADFERVGEYKSAVEAFDRASPSEPAREMDQALLDSLYQGFVQDAAAGRGLQPAELRALVDDPPVTASGALERGLVDTLAYHDSYLDQLDVEFRRASTRFRRRHRGWHPGRRVVAILHLQGTIIDGRSDTSPVGGGSVGDRTVARRLRRLREDDDVAAVVLRVNSPGGSGLASDVIWHAVQRLDAEKPVVVSMGPLAASGGYYVSMGARRIFALPFTLTGSIGVFGGKLSVGGLFEKLGITTWETHRGAMAGIFDVTRPFSGPERAKIRERIQGFYRSFVEKAAQGRGLTEEQVDAVARGRVWTGAQAVGIGLVDQLGGLEDAVGAAASMAGLGNDFEREVLPQPPGLLDSISRELGRSGDDAAILPPAAARELAPLWQAARLRTMLQREGIAAMLPFQIQVR